ncbi:1-acyl-sn-glycerol-3-phosphate acyltransferase [Brevibacterium yomogidense]|nr:1-acyl-sn-glycerol-3-phosphate acyltransferase [Brevibacterium yomogidense]
MGKPPRSAALDLWHRWVLTCMRRASFVRVRSGGAVPGPRRRPRLIVSSHRNGAIDGALVQSAFPHAQYLVSMQLLRGPLRLLFTGIPVIRQRDVERYGMDRSSVNDPVSAGVDHLRAGGDLVIFPEGTSEWQHTAGAYQRGAAKIVCRLQEAGVDVDVIPVGLFYLAPERFGTMAELWCGPDVDLPPDTDGPRIEREKRAHAILSEALDAVSVHCPDPQTFDIVQRRATDRARAGESFAASFLDEQAAAVPGMAGTAVADGGPAAGSAVSAEPVTASGPASAATAAPSPWPRRLGIALHWLFAPVLLAGWFAGTKADARNTVTFFRSLGGSAGVVIWLVLVVVGGVWMTLAGAGATAAAVAGAGVVSAVLGRLILRARRWQPDTAPMDTGLLNSAARDAAQNTELT